MTSGLTPRMAQCLKAIRDLTVDGVPPTLRELTSLLGFRSASGTHRLLSIMKGRGLLDWTPDRARSLRIIERPSFHDLSRLDEAALEAVAADIKNILFRQSVKRLTGFYPGERPHDRAEPRP